MQIFHYSVTAMIPPIAHELMYIMYQHLRNAELKAEAEKQGLWNKYMQIIVEETEKVTKKYCHVFLQESVLNITITQTSLL